MQSRYINGYNIFSFGSKEEFLNQINDEPKILIAMNAEKILKNDEKLRHIVNHNIGYTDGAGAVMALRRKGLDPVKIPGTEFWLNIVTRYPEKKYYLIGSTQDVIEETVLKLRRDFPGLDIAGYRNGYVKEEEKTQIHQDLLRTKPDIVFIAQGSPLQEFFMDELMRIYPAIYMGLGGSFDIYTGKKKRAPQFFLERNLEWLYRLIKEPTRIKRQRHLMTFLILMLRKKL